MAPRIKSLRFNLNTVKLRGFVDFSHFPAWCEILASKLKLEKLHLSFRLRRREATDDTEALPLIHHELLPAAQTIPVLGSFSVCYSEYPGRFPEDPRYTRTGGWETHKEQRRAMIYSAMEPTTLLKRPEKASAMKAYLDARIEASRAEAALNEFSDEET